MDRVLKYRRKTAALLGGGAYPDLFAQYLQATPERLKPHFTQMNPDTLQGASANPNQVRMDFINDLLHLMQKPTEGRLYDQLALSIRTLHLKELRDDHDNRRERDGLDGEQMGLFRNIASLIQETRDGVEAAVRKLHPQGRDRKPIPDADLMSGTLTLVGTGRNRSVAAEATAQFFGRMRRLATLFKKVAKLEVREHQLETRRALAKLDDIISGHSRHAASAARMQSAARGKVRGTLAMF